MKHFNNIVYVTEPAANQDAALARAVALAQNHQARLTVVEVVPEITSGIGMAAGGPSSADLADMIMQQRQQALDALLEPHCKLIKIHSEILVGKLFLQVIKRVLSDDVDLLIKPAENPDFISRLFGSDDMHLLRKCPCPVWIMKPQEKSNYQRIVAAIDFDINDDKADEQTFNRQILELASMLAVSDFAELHLVHVWDAPQAGFVRVWADDPEMAELKIIESERGRHQNRMDELIEKLNEWIGVEAYDSLSPRVHMPMGNAKKEIPTMALNLKADMVVMGTVGRGGIPGLIIGNTAEAILDQLQCSVLAIKPPGFKTPAR